MFNNNGGNKETNDTIALLKHLHHGRNGIRDIKAQAFYKDLQQQILGFLQILSNYQTDPTPANKQAVIDSLAIEKEYLGFKRWIIKNSPELFPIFKNNIKWN